MMSDDNDGQMTFGDLGGLKLPDICLTGEEKPQKNLIQGTCPDWGSNPVYRLSHSGGLKSRECKLKILMKLNLKIIFHKLLKYPQLMSNTRSGRGMRCDEAPIL